MNFKAIRLSFIFGFLILLVIPNLIMLANLEDDDQSVMVLNDHPLYFNFMDPLGSVRSFKIWYAENFGLKRTFIKNYVSLKNNVFDEDPIPNRVITGKEGYYFIGNHFNNLVNDSFGMETLSEEDLEHIAMTIEVLRNELRKRQINFYLVVAPNKHRIYQEKLPFEVENKPTRLKQLDTYLRNNLDFAIIDFESTLNEQKKIGPIYHKTDTHWNQIGAYTAYHHCMEIVNEQTSSPIIDVSKFQISSIPIRSTTANMIDLDIEEFQPELKNPESRVKIQSNSTQSLRIYHNEYGTHRLLMFHDSFGYYWMNFFNESFEDSYFSKGYEIDLETIDSIQPDVIILEVVERNLIETFKNLKIE